MSNDKWSVKVTESAGFIHIAAVKGTVYSNKYNYYVRQPNFIERLCGITYVDKVNHTYMKVRKYCDKENGIKDETSFTSLLEKFCLEEDAGRKKELNKKIPKRQKV
jgi:hypothetical protein